MLPLYTLFHIFSPFFEGFDSSEVEPIIKIVTYSIFYNSSPFDFEVNILENQPSNLFVTSVFAEDLDLDENSRLSFRIDPASDLNGHFYTQQQNANTAHILTRAILDRETM